MSLSSNNVSLFSRHRRLQYACINIPLFWTRVLFFCCNERGAKGKKDGAQKTKKQKKVLLFLLVCGLGWSLVIWSCWFWFFFLFIVYSSEASKAKRFLGLGLGGWWLWRLVEGTRSGRKGARSLSLFLFFPLPLSNFTSSSSSSPRQRPTRQHRLPRKDHRLLQQQQPRQPRRRPQSPRRRG